MSLPRVIVMANGKGGTGKTALARSLAAHWYMSKFKPALIDADPQATLTKLHRPNGPMGGVPVITDAEAATVQHTIAEAAAAHQPVVVDTAGFRNQTTILAAIVADLIVIPIKAAAEDLLEAVEMFDLVRELNQTPERAGNPLQVLMVLTMTIPGTVIARHIRSELETGGYPLLQAELTLRVAYPELSMQGLAPSIVEPDSPGARDVARIAAEIGKRMEVPRVEAA